MRRIELGGLAATIDDGGEGDRPALVLLHGFGAAGDDLVPLGRMIDVPPGTRLVFPEAPLEIGLPFSDARAWWMIDTGRFEREVASGRGASRAPDEGGAGSEATTPMSREVPHGMAAAHSALVEALAALSAPRLVLGGFSQGAMLACDVALRTGIALAGLALLSPTIVAEDEWAPRFAARRGLPVLMSHGTEDPLLPYAVSERLRDLWRQAGADVELVGFRGGHEIPDLVLHRLGTFLRRTLG